jgi:hypothetical protein
VESKLGPLGTSASHWPIVPAPGDCEDGELGELNARGNRNTRSKPVPTPLCPPQIPLDQTRDWTLAAAVGSQRLTASVMARPSALGIATGYGLGSRGIRIHVLVGEDFSSLRLPDGLWGPPSLLFFGCGRLLSETVKRPGRKADYLPPTNAEVKNTWIYSSNPPYVFMAWW